MLLQATDIYIRYAQQPIIDHQNLFIEEKEKIGIVGVNGMGKSTLLKMIAHLDSAYASFATKPHIQISYLEQQPRFAETLCISQLLESNKNQVDEYRLRSLLSRFGLRDETLPIGKMSGGQQKKLALALALSREADLLILDEPTNHLDMAMIMWLEKYLTHTTQALLMVTHDRYFLDRITSTIIEVNHGQLYLSHGGYQGYLEQVMSRQQESIAKERKRAALLRQEKAWAEAGVEARRTKSRARLQRYHDLLEESNQSLVQTMNITTTMQRMGRKTIRLEAISKKYGERVLWQPFSYAIQPYDRIGVLGDNGVGKTTLLNIICGKDQDYEGKVEIGETIRIGYFDQQSMSLDLHARAYDYILNISNAVETTEGTMDAKTMMQQFLFDEQSMYLPIARLSGGQQRRLYLLGVLMKNPNVLIFDEPTNDLDIDTLAVLEDYLDRFDGILIVVSHDRYFLDKVVDKLLILKDGMIQIYQGSCSDYLEMLEKPHKNQLKSKVETVKKNISEKLTYQEKKELEQLNEALPILEAQLAALTQAFAAEQLDYEAICSLSLKQATLEEELEKKTERWLALCEKQEKSQIV